MKNNSAEIVIIHDELKRDDNLVFMLEEKYGVDKVHLIGNSDKGLEYVTNNLSKKMVIILDRNFKDGEPTGLEVFLDIRKQTSLVYIIIWTADPLGQIDTDELKNFINNDAMALLTSSDDTKLILEKIDHACHQLDIRVSSALEQWINIHPDAEKNTPYMITREGKSYTLTQMAEEIRKKSDFGLQIEKDILLLAIDLLARGKKKIDG